MEIQKIDVRIEGIADIMFDKFYDHSKASRPAEQKFYLFGENEIVLPSSNFHSFLLGERKPGAIKTVEGKGARDYLQAAHGHIFLDKQVINFTSDREGKKKVIFNGFTKKSPFYICEESGVAGSGSKVIKLPIEPRPVLKLPWFLEFQIHLVNNPIFDEPKLFNWVTVGGIMVAIGTYRPRYGRFQVDKWDKV